MYTYLLTTALMSVGLENPVVTNPVNITGYNTLHSHENILKLSLRMDASKGFTNGDFNSIGRSMSVEPLYTGAGSREMASVRLYRF